jgi:hypothetical protein
MKKLIILFILCTFVCTTMRAQTGPPACDDFVTLQGKYFQCDGVLFYPLACTYAFQIVYNSNNPYNGYNDLFLSRAGGYGPSTMEYAGNDCVFGYCDFEGCTAAACSTEIVNDLTKIHEMGFNSIRTHVAPGFTNESPDEYTMVEHCFCCPDHCGVSETLEIPGVNGTGTARKCAFILETLQIAHACHLKVFLDVAYDKTLSNETHFDAYMAYLESLAQYISNIQDVEIRQTLAAYIILEEPGTQQPQPAIPKHEICDKVGQMYTLLKENDPEHLVGVGGKDISDVMNWDPGVMKLDFFCPHLYPYPEPDKGEVNSDYAVERVLGEIYWLKNNSTMPWMIGETGFGATDDNLGKTADPIHDGWPWEWDCGDLHYPTDYEHQPKIDGELETAINGEYYTQVTFAQDVLKMVRDCGGSGFTMWDFQEISGATTADIETNGIYPDVNGDCHGLLRHGNPSNKFADDGVSPIEKPVVNLVFLNYLDENGQPPAVDPNGVQPPSNWDNPYNHPTRLNDDVPNGPFHNVTGTITDNNGHDIKNAYVWAFCSLGIPSGEIDEVQDLIYTFTNDLGVYNVNSIDHNPSYGPPKDYIIRIKVSAPGGSVIESSFVPGPDFSTSIIKTDVVTNAEISNITLHNGDNEHYVAWNSITAEDITIQAGATAEFKALQEIQINHDFDANTNSEVHIWCTRIFPECTDFSGYKSPATSNGLQTETAENNNDIELKFMKRPDANSISIEPNPSSGLFWVNYFNVDNTGMQNICIYELTGRKIYETKVTGNSYLLDLSGKPKGVYFVVVIDAQMQNYTQKIIIN